jgi:hypothetical protein
MLAGRTAQGIQVSKETLIERIMRNIALVRRNDSMELRLKPEMQQESNFEIRRTRDS